MYRMTPFVLALTITATVMFAVATVVCYRAIRGALWVRILMALRSFYAAVYVVAYTYLMFNQHRQIGWGQLMRGVGLASIPVVWIIPAVLARRQHDRDTATIAELRKSIPGLDDGPVL